MRTEYTNSIVQFFNDNAILQYAGAIAGALIFTVIILHILFPERHR